MEAREVLTKLTELDCVTDDRKCNPHDETCPFLEVVMQGEGMPYCCRAPRWDKDKIDKIIEKLTK